MIPIFTRSLGLDTSVNPLAYQYNPDTGIQRLATAVNITHDKTGMISSRPGYELVATGNFHSLFCAGKDCYIGKDNNLYKVGSDLSLTGVRGGLQGTRISYWQDADTIYYTNGFQNGILVGGLSYPWPEHAYDGPPTTRSFSAAPIGTHIAVFNGRMLIAVGHTIFISEPWGYGLFNLANYIDFTSNVVMILPTDFGVYVSDEESTWFFEGQHFTDFKQTKVAEYPALEWSETTDTVDAATLGLDVTGLSWLWGSTNGAVLGLPTGQIINLTVNKVKYPNIGTKGAGLLYGNNFIHSMFF